MPTNTKGDVARADPRQVVNTLKATVNFNDPNVANGNPFGGSNGVGGVFLPKGAFITSVLVQIVVAFNAGTTNVLTVGTNASSYNNIVQSGDVTATSIAVTPVTRALGALITAAADVLPLVTYTQTGGAATPGQAIIVISFEGGWLS